MVREGEREALREVHVVGEAGRDGREVLRKEGGRRDGKCFLTTYTCMCTYLSQCALHHIVEDAMATIILPCIQGMLLTNNSVCVLRSLPFTAQASKLLLLTIMHLLYRASLVPRPPASEMVWDS